MCEIGYLRYFTHFAYKNNPKKKNIQIFLLNFPLSYMNFCNMQVFLQFLTQNIWYLGFFDLTLQMKNKNKLIFKTKIRKWKKETFFG